MAQTGSILEPIVAGITSAFGWGVCVASATFVAFWAGVSLGVERLVAPLDILLLAILSPLMIGSAPSLILLIVGIPLAWYVPAKIEIGFAYVAAFVAIVTTAFLVAWLSVSERANLWLTIFGVE